MTAAPPGAPRADAPAATCGSVIVSTPSPTPPPAARGLGALTPDSRGLPMVCVTSVRHGLRVACVAGVRRGLTVGHEVSALRSVACGPVATRGVGALVSVSQGMPVGRGLGVIPISRPWVTCGFSAGMAASSGVLRPFGGVVGFSSDVGVGTERRSGERCRRPVVGEMILSRGFGTAWGGRAEGVGAGVGVGTSSDGFGCSVSGFSRGGVVDRAVGATQGGGD